MSWLAKIMPQQKFEKKIFVFHNDPKDADMIAVASVLQTQLEGGRFAIVSADNKSIIITADALSTTPVVQDGRDVINTLNGRELTIDPSLYSAFDAVIDTGALGKYGQLGKQQTGGRRRHRKSHRKGSRKAHRKSRRSTRRKNHRKSRRQH